MICFPGHLQYKKSAQASIKSLNFSKYKNLYQTTIGPAEMQGFPFVWYSWMSIYYHKLIESLSPVPGTSSPFLGDICHSQIYAFEQGIICWKYCFWLCKKVNSAVELNSIVTIYNISSISYATASLEIIQTRFAVGIWNFIMLYPCWLSKNPFSPSPLAFVIYKHSLLLSVQLASLRKIFCYQLGLLHQRKHCCLQAQSHKEPA